jgi:hypothetical protein
MKARGHAFYRNIITVACLLLGNLVHTSIRAQQGTEGHEKIKKLEQEVGALSEKLSNSVYPDRNDDSLNNWNALLQNGLLELSLGDPAFLEKEYKTWADQGLYVVSADDRALRIVFWNSQYGGTLRDYFAILFYKTKQGTAYYMLENTDLYSYIAIHTFTRKDSKKFYLLTYMGHASSRDKANGISACSIENDKLDVTTIAFKAGKKMLNEISFTFDMTSVNSEKDFIHFSADKKQLFVPVVKDEGKVVSGKYLRYRFDGNYFVFETTR